MWPRLLWLAALLLGSPALVSAQTCVVSSNTPIQAVLTWQDTGIPASATFVVNRATSASGPWTQIGTAAALATTYTDATTAIGFTYYYTVQSTMNGLTSPVSNLACKAFPPPAPATLTISLLGTGTGTVRSSPAGIACPSTCSAAFMPGATIGLTAKQSPSSRFGGWSGGGCAGTGGCVTVLPLGGETVIALFTHK